ncbi:hypothetical protein GALL_466850 [mine drainage metagenome]|uniref:Uncharacterized protein n=1 Tax=mine drainage metagenome TaxID=410659 RepID=A0A1J5Q6X5_9ZZZZ
MLIDAQIPQAAGIRADFVGDDQALEVAFPDAADLDLEIGEADADAQHDARHEIVDAQRERHHVVKILLPGPAEGDDVFLGDQRIVELVVLEVELDNRARQRGAFGDAKAGRDRACGVVAHHDLDRDDFGGADQLFAHVDAADEMGGHADGVQPGHEEFRQAVVQHAFPLDHVLFQGVYRGGVILEILHKGSGLGAFVKDLGLPLEYFLAPRHGNSDPHADGSDRALWPAICHDPLCRKAAPGLVAQACHTHMQGIITKTRG